MLNPKRKKHSVLYKQNEWYPYYASYSDLFVADLIEHYNLDSSRLRVLDPWNGTGTTTFCCAAAGLRSYGFDINPVMNIVSRAKLCNPLVINVKNIRRNLQNLKRISYQFDRDDPLLTWYTQDTVINIRKIERMLLKYEKIIPKNFTYWKFHTEISNSNNMNFLYLILFHILKNYSAPFIGSNPTWIKSKNISPIEINADNLIKAFFHLFDFFCNNYTPFCNFEPPVISCSDSNNIPLRRNSIDLVISSPPYCTRIDYAIYTQLELSLLGFAKTDVRALRELLIGSPTIHQNHQDIQLDHLIYCNSVLDKIEFHSSKASKSYYLKTYKQYFFEMEQSIAEISRVLRKNKHAVLVIQESWFKNIRIDLPKIVLELAEKHHMNGHIERYAVKQNIVNINTKSRKYTAKKEIYEAVIFLQKKGV